MAGSRYADSTAFQAPEFSYMHAMSSSAWSAEEAQRRMCEYVQAYGDVYRQMIASPAPGYHGQAYFALGMALHAIMDSTSPEHRGFQYWPDMTDSAILGAAPRHGGIDQSPLSRESLRHAAEFRDETLSLMKRVANGDYTACGCP
jgi:hypothetical protein